MYKGRFMKKLHEKKISELLGEDGHYYESHYLLETKLKEWAISVVKEIRNPTKVVEIDGHIYDNMIHLGTITWLKKDIHVLETFLIDRFEITEKELE